MFMLAIVEEVGFESNNVICMAGKIISRIEAIIERFLINSNFLIKLPKFLQI